MTQALHSAIAILVLTVLYLAAGKFGLAWAVVHPSASAVWPPSGIALAALLLCGYRLWPGVFLGAFLVNITTAASVATALGIAAGNTAEALLAAWLICRFAAGSKAFERARNIPLFIAFAVLGTAAGATAGVTSLSAGGLAPWEQYPAIWLTWWLGDFVGVLIVTPLLVLWMTRPLTRPKTRQVWEAVFLLLSVAFVGRAVFLARIPSGLEYLAIPPVLWAAFRFGARGAATTAFVTCVIAIWGAARGLGPFAILDPNHSLLLLQLFMGSVAMMGLILASLLAERKRAEEILRENESRLRLITDTAPVLLAHRDDERRYKFVNRAYAERLGLTPEEIVGKSISEVLGAEADQAIRPHVENVLEGQPVEYETEIPYRQLGPRFMRVAYLPEKNAQGKVVGWVSALSDITDRKQAEEALRQAKDELARSNEELETQVQQRTAELERANAALLREMEEQKVLEDQLRQAQKMESIGTLAGGIAHDFNNLLNIIKGYASLLGRRRSGDQELKAGLQVIDETIERGASTVRQLLAVARRSEVEFEPVDINSVLEDLTSLLAETFPKTIEIALSLDRNLPPVLADPNQINQAMLNICVNSRDAMPEGGELLLTTETVRGAELRERHQEAREDLYACISVADTGLGMSEVVKSRIFEPFFTTKDQGQGTGLGLAVVYGILAKHGGFIEVASEPGRGSTFRVYLPIAGDKVRSIDKDRSLESRRSEKPAACATILFVEDEAKQLELMQNFLESEGYRVLTARDGAEAFETYLRRKGEISVVVLDLGLPKLNGWEVYQQMKQVDPTVKPILATGYVSPEMESALARGEISAVIMKPYRLDEVVGNIRAVIEKSTNASP